MSSLPRVVSTAPVKREHLANARQHSLRLLGLQGLKPAARCVVNGLSPRRTSGLHYSSKAAVCRAVLQQLLQSPGGELQVLSVEMAEGCHFPPL